MSSLVLKHRADLQSYQLLDGEDVVSEVGYDRHGSTLVLLRAPKRRRCTSPTSPTTGSAEVTANG